MIAITSHRVDWANGVWGDVLANLTHKENHNQKPKRSSGLAQAFVASIASSGDSTLIPAQLFQGISACAVARTTGAKNSTPLCGWESCR